MRALSFEVVVTGEDRQSGEDTGDWGGKLGEERCWMERGRELFIFLYKHAFIALHGCCPDPTSVLLC